MTIIVKNKHTLQIDEFKFKCCIGKKGSTYNKKEGDKKTPKGTFKIENLYFREDRVKNLKSRLKMTAIKDYMGWCDDPKSDKYNKLIRFPFNYSAEKLYRRENIYDILLVLNFNMNPIKKNKGSAIFIHVAKKSFQPTQGCIALNKSELIKLVKSIKKNTVVKII